MSYVYVFSTIVLTVYAQIIIKSQVLKAGVLPEEFGEKLIFLLQLLLNFWVISAFAAAFLAALTWMAAMTKLQLSHAYPFMGLTFVLILLASGYFFNEPVTVLKIAGVILIAAGLVVASQG